MIARIGCECWRIYVVDDACPEGSGDLVEARCSDPRVRVIRHRKNLGVGAAVMSGYRAAVSDGAQVIVKIDGDGQMAPELLPGFVAPILDGQADYCKGNRFYELDHLDRMPLVRKLGNAALSFMAKLSAGYWDIFDPANGFTAIHAAVARRLPFDKISQRYFFETDMLFRLNTIRAVVVDIPMDATYGDETSSLKVSRVFAEFLYKNLRNGAKRVFYNYFLRDFTIASLELVVGLVFLCVRPDLRIRALDLVGPGGCRDCAGHRHARSLAGTRRCAVAAGFRRLRHRVGPEAAHPPCPRAARGNGTVGPDEYRR